MDFYIIINMHVIIFGIMTKYSMEETTIDGELIWLYSFLLTLKLPGISGESAVVSIDTLTIHFITRLSNSFLRKGQRRVAGSTYIYILKHA